MRNICRFRLSAFHIARSTAMSELVVSLILVAVTLALANPAIAGGNKVDVCHIPPGNPDNIHTISINDNALDAHLAHGDFLGSCNEFCATLCDDGDACTIDDLGNCEENGCPAIPKPIDCDDGAAWTEDTCDSNSGCLNTSLCPCWNGGPDSYPGILNLADLWTTVAPAECRFEDECEDILGNLGPRTTANCIDNLSQPEGTVVGLSTHVIDNDLGFIVIKQCSWTRFIATGTGGARGKSNNTDLTDDELAICQAEHDFFTANTDFPNGFNDSCGLPDPEE